ncbi:hypothetical protein CP_0890 [Chlamydia pneumoniae AR39]|uniref:Uncharacterized protein n=1 Tax=Chlamydia pneumoniae TaxID=83558 RepID=Q9K1V7_CHLPN|nr:hypothetical protein CP_0890 [Chlamydia pneumoniae AR39]CRI73660.1 Uncharacterized protein BN1224_YK41_CA_00060 [Chlamydia pneumoniae]
MGLYDRDYIQDSRVQGTFASRVYRWMTAGLIVTSCVALGLYFSGLYRSLFSFWWVWCFATLGVSFFINSKIQTLSVVGQVMAYAMVLAKGMEIDCPRNLAKSVTVE